MLKLTNRDPIENVSDNKIPIRLGCVKPSGIPLIISLWYVIRDEKIYCATQSTAKLVSYLRKNPVCCFEIAADKPPYKGTRGEGTVKIMSEKGSDILNVLIEKYLGKKDSTLSKFLKQKASSEVAIEITPQKMFHYDYTQRMKDI
jgi:hypothetical protein